MGVIKYFLPNCTRDQVCDQDGKVNCSRIGELGLTESLRDVRKVPRDATLTGVQHGPSGSGGILLTPTQADGLGRDNCCYDADSQIWIKSDSGRYWLGTKTGEPVTPAAVQRRKVYLGYSVEVDEGLSWLIPIARAEDDSRVTLPQDIVFAGGIATKRLRSQYRHLWDLATQVVDWCSGEASPASDEAWRINTAMVAMNMNYRIWHDEVNLCLAAEYSILSSQIIDPICLSIADVQFAMDVKKKELLEHGQELRGSDGSMAGIEDGSNTIPVVAN